MKRMASSDNAAPDNSGATGASVETSDGGRALIVDEASFEEQFLRCQVCNEKFEQTERMPKSLPCNHTFCLPCLTQIFDHAQPPNRRTLLWADEGLDGALKCPTCRVEIFLARNKIKELPNDHRVIQMIDFLSQAVSKSHNVCGKHERQPLNFFCKKCLVPVCRDCTVLDHKESEGHNITDVSEALSENSTQFAEIENNSRQTLEKMKARSDALANASKRLDILERRMKGEIKETFIEYRLLMEKRQEAMIAQVSAIVKEQKALINAKFVGVCEHGTQLQKLYDEFKASRSSNDIRKLFTINQEMKDHENQFTEVATQEDHELFQSCEFEAVNEGAFLTDMLGLGEVRKRPDPDLKEPVPAHQLRYLDMEEQRERQRRLEAQGMAYGGLCDDSMEPYQQAMEQQIEPLMGQYEEYEVEDSDEADEQRSNLPPTPHMEVSRLISRYMREVRGSRDYPTPDTGMETDDTPITATRRSMANRRGRRNRDTNSSGVTSSLASPTEYLRSARAVAAEMAERQASASYSSQPRSGSRSRSERSGLSGQAGFPRVVRHLRHQTGHADDN